MAGCGVEELANDLLATLIADGEDDFQLPDVDLNDPTYQLPAEGNEINLPVAKLTNADLTTQVIGGPGTFDVLMEAINTHLTREFESGRITGREYSEAYTSAIEAALGQGTQFLLARETSYWTAVGAQLQAQAQQVALVTQRVQLAQAKTQLAAMRYEALTQKSQYAMTKMQLATASVQYCTAKYNLEKIMPVQLETLQLQKTAIQVANDTATYQLNVMLPGQKMLLDKQLAGSQIANDTAQYQLVNSLPAQLELIKQQVEVQHAQIADFLMDGETNVNGAIGKQKQLYDRQMISFEQDAKLKVGKLFSDAWVVQKSADEGIEPPDNFTNAVLDDILDALKESVELPTST